MKKCRQLPRFVFAVAVATWPAIGGPSAAESDVPTSSRQSASQEIVRQVAQNDLVKVEVGARGDATVARIRRELEKAFFLARLNLGSEVGGTFSVGGPIRIVALGGIKEDYRAHLPEIAWHDDKTGVQADLGNLTIDVTILGEHELKFAVALPPSFFVRDRRGDVFLRVSSRERSLVGVWNEQILSFRELRGRVAEVDIRGVVSAGYLTIDEIDLTSEVIDSGTGELESSFAVGVRRIDVDTGAGQTMRAHHLSNRGTTRGIDKLAFTALQASMLEATRTATDRTSLLLAQLDEASRLFGSATVHFRLDDLTVADRDAELDLPTLSSTLSFGGFRSGNAGWMELVYAHDGLGIVGDGMIEDLIPRRVAVRLRLGELPVDQLRDELVEGLQNSRHAGQDMAIAVLLNRLIDTIGEAKPLLTLDQLVAASDTASVEGHGRVVPDLTAALSATGTGTFMIRGLERLAERILDSDLDGKASVLAVLGVLMALGEESSGSNATTHIYRIELDASGGVTVNGKNFSNAVRR